MDESSLIVILRPFCEDDKACIFTTWRNGLWYGSNTNFKVNSKIFFKNQTEKIKSILDNAFVKIACLEIHPTTIVGYSVSTGDHLDWIYVKADYRSKGIGKLLLPKDIKTHTADLTKIGAAIVKQKNLTTKEN